MASNAGPEEITLDENKEAAQHTFYMVAATTVRPQPAELLPLLLLILQ